MEQQQQHQQNCDLRLQNDLDLDLGVTSHPQLHDQSQGGLQFSDNKFSNGCTNGMTSGFGGLVSQQCQTTVTRFGPKVGQIGPKWDKSGKFSDQIQYILAHRAKM